MANEQETSIPQPKSTRFKVALVLLIVGALLLIIGALLFLVSFLCGLSAWTSWNTQMVSICGTGLAVGFTLFLIGVIMLFMGRLLAKKQKNQNTP